MPADPETDRADSDPTDGMPSRAYLAHECLLYRMRQLSETFYAAQWVDDLEFEVWDMAHKQPYCFADNPVSESMAKSFRDLATLAGGWWVWPKTVGQDGHIEMFIPLEQWLALLDSRQSDSQKS